ncbi:MAG TPA: hypothetical protein VGK47_06775 [Nitrososphaeraceae archaeon]
MEKTNQEIKMSWRGYDITIPKGTRITHNTALGVDPKYNFVDDLSWIDKKTQFGLHHDATYYGIDVPAEFVSEIGDFETGATSAAVNELILYTDNTRELVAKRDYTFYSLLAMPDETPCKRFDPLLGSAEKQYNKELGKIWWATDKERQEYCQIYANRFAEWKKEKELHNQQK